MLWTPSGHLSGSGPRSIAKPRQRAMSQNPNRTPSEYPNPHKNRLKWVVHLPRNGTIGFDPQPYLAHCESSELWRACLLRNEVLSQPFPSDTDTHELMPPKSGNQQVNSLTWPNIPGLPAACKTHNKKLEACSLQGSTLDVAGLCKRIHLGE